MTIFRFFASRRSETNHRSRTTRRSRAARVGVEGLEGKQLLSTISPLSITFGSAGVPGNGCLPLVMPDGHTTSGAIWQTQSGTTIGNFNDPIAVWSSMPSTLVRGQYTPNVLDYTISFPNANASNGGNTMKIVYSASLTGKDTTYSPNSGTSTGHVSGTVNGTSALFQIPLPKAVGQYDLKVTVQAYLYGGSTPALTQVRDTTLYNLFRTTPEPISYPFYNESSQLKTAPLANSSGAVDLKLVQEATAWAAGATTDQQVMTDLNNAIYSNPLNWSYVDAYSSPVSMLEGQSTEGVCNSIADTLSVLATLDGLDVGMTRYSFLGLVPASHPALSGKGPGNAIGNDYNVATGQIDGTFSGWHVMVTYKGKYYDPTFGYIGSFDPNAVNDPFANWGANLEWVFYINPGTSYTDFEGTAVQKNGDVVGTCHIVLGPSGGYGILNPNGWAIEAFAPNGTTMPSDSQLVTDIQAAIAAKQS